MHGLHVTITVVFSSVVEVCVSLVTGDIAIIDMTDTAMLKALLSRKCL
jgi:hypothetical protein